VDAHVIGEAVGIRREGIYRREDNLVTGQTVGEFDAARAVLAMLALLGYGHQLVRRSVAHAHQ
jgi:hypothetical protein